MLSQLLYGETCEVIGTTQNFAQIRADFDGTSGFVDFHCLVPDLNSEKSVIVEPYKELQLPEGITLLSVGSEISKNATDEPLTKNISDLALQFLNVPFLQGGRSFFGTDASAFVQLLFKVAGYRLPRSVAEQAEHGTVLDFLGESRSGDLAFFEDDEEQINHVGMVLDSGEVIHCYGKVRKDLLDTSGIYNQDLKKHTHKLRFVRRIKLKTT